LQFCYCADGQLPVLLAILKSTCAPETGELRVVGCSVTKIVKIVVTSTIKRKASNVIFAMILARATRAVHRRELSYVEEPTEAPVAKGRE
jgi:hypothetical protein